MELTPPLEQVRNDLPLMKGGPIVVVARIGTEILTTKPRSASVPLRLAGTAKSERSLLPI